MERILSHTICECKYHIVMTVSIYWTSTRPDESPVLHIGWLAFGWPDGRPLGKEVGHVCERI